MGVKDPTVYFTKSRQVTPVPWLNSHHLQLLVSDRPGQSVPEKLGPETFLGRPHKVKIIWTFEEVAVDDKENPSRPTRFYLQGGCNSLPVFSLVAR